MNKALTMIMVVVVLIAAIAVVYFAMLKEDSTENGPELSAEPGTSLNITKAALPGTSNNIVINAADYEKIEGPLEVEEQDDYAGGKSLYLPDAVLGKPAELKAKVTYKFLVPEAGTYKVWIRHWWKDECANSLFLVFDDGPGMLFGRRRHRESLALASTAEDDGGIGCRRT
ncbi:MAG: hypothetical protein U5N86_13005 [Planctomycetota bacterium]|nr:hypothetical protein [Planctomycetota bacterium]